MEEAGVAVIALCEGVEDSEFAKSRPTRQATCRQLEILSQAAVAIPPSVRTALPEIDWSAGLRIAQTSIVEPNRSGLKAVSLTAKGKRICSR